MFSAHCLMCAGLSLVEKLATDRTYVQVELRNVVSLTSVPHRRIERSKGKHVFGASSMFTRLGGVCDLATDRHSVP